MNNLDLIKNINKQNRLNSKERKRSLSGDRRYSKDTKSAQVNSTKNISQNS